jgi:hypothetical protein
VQVFFKQPLSRSYLSQADPNCGNFHMFLKDPGPDERFLTESNQTANPEPYFDRMWALNVLEESNLGGYSDVDVGWGFQRSLLK